MPRSRSSRWRCWRSSPRRSRRSCKRRSRTPRAAIVGLANFIAYARTPALLDSLWNSVWVSLLVTTFTLPAAFGFAYALTRSRMRFKGLARTITLVPLLAPSLLSAISLIYWFGNQGVLKSWLEALGIEQIYGAPGIVLAETFSTFPHALMILVTALAAADARLYEAADAMGTSAQRKFFTITLARRQVRPDLGGARDLHARDDGLRHPQGHRRQLQRAGHRRLQARHRPAGLPEGRGRRVAAAGAGGADLCGRPLGQPQADGDAQCARRALPAQARAALRRPDVALRAGAVRADPRDAGDGGVRVVRHLLALQPHAEPAPLRDGPRRRRSRRCLRQQPRDGRRARRCSARSSCSAAPTCSRRRRACVRCAAWCACWRCCRWRCPGWCWVSATSSSSTSPPIRSTACITRSRC